MKKLYFFDFDGTLTTNDTMFMFLRHCDKNRFAKQFVIHLPLFALLKLKLAKAENVKRHFVASVLKGHTESFIQEKSHSFFEENYPSIIRENALEFINNINRQLSESYIVTASLNIWVKPFAEKFGMKLIATEALFTNGIFTGKFKGANCNGEEKVRRIKEEIKDKKFDKSIAFGDTDGDRPMLDFVTEGHYQFFH